MGSLQWWRLKKDVVACRNLLFKTNRRRNLMDKRKGHEKRRKWRRILLNLSKYYPVIPHGWRLCQLNSDGFVKLRIPQLIVFNFLHNSYSINNMILFRLIWNRSLIIDNVISCQIMIYNSCLLICSLVLWACATVFYPS